MFGGTVTIEVCASFSTNEMYALVVELLACAVSTTMQFNYNLTIAPAHI